MHTHGIELMIAEETGYRSFLLRIQVVKHNTRRIWRVSLENPRSRERQSFSSLEELIVFLHSLEEILEGEMRNEAR